MINHPDKMLGRRGLRLILILSLGWALASVNSLAQNQAQPTSTPPEGQTMPGVSDDPITRSQVDAFNQFLDNHPQIAGALARDPRLIDNKEFVESHPELGEWLKAHPKVSEAIHENPRRFMRREDTMLNSDQEIDAVTRSRVRAFDEFLDNHPQLASQLAKNPELIDNKQWVDSHPQLVEWLKDHPEVSESLHQHPRAFMRRERGFDQNEK